jgi:hypothetical protein
MRQYTRFLILIIGLISVGEAVALSNEEMLSDCEAFKLAVYQETINIKSKYDRRIVKVINDQRCSGFIQAVKQAVIHKKLRVNICLPKEASIFQLSSVYTSYVREHPELWHTDAFPVVLTSWERLFRCK